MAINFKFTPLLIAVIAFADIVALQAKETHEHPPMANAEEAKIRHWNVPEIARNFWDIPELETPYMDASPSDIKDDIPVGVLGEDAGNKNTIMNLAKEIADKQHGEVDSLLIAHKGELLFESYYLRGRLDLPHPQSSTTKSYTALAIGRAIQKGYLALADLDKPLVRFLPGLDLTRFAKGADKITLHEAMTMSSGLQISDEQLEHYRENPDQYKGIKQVQGFFEDSAPITQDAKVFNYKGADPDLVMQVLNAVVPGSAEAFIKEELFLPMGIDIYDWRAGQSGLPAAGASSSMTSRNMLKIGLLVMDGGKWNDEQLIPKAFIEKATSNNVRLSTEQVSNFYAGESLSGSGYGYFWWQTDMKVQKHKHLSKSAQGGGGVTILFVEDLELVIVVTAHARQAYLQMIAEKVLPAFIK